MHKSLIPLYTFLFVTLITINAMAMESAPAPKGGPANAEFQQVFAEWKQLVGDLGALKAKYRTAQKPEQKEIEKQWVDILEKGKVLKPRLIQATEKAFIEAPNTDKEITAFLLNIFKDEVAFDDYENAARIGKLLIDNKCGDPKTVIETGIAAVNVNDYASAEKYLGMASTGGYYKQLEPQDKLAQQGQYYYGNLAKFKKAWDKEKSLRDAEAKADDLPRVLLKTNKGDIEIELFENEAPIATANFITLVEKGFYNGLTFHRVLENFMAQGGDPKGDGTGGPGYTIPCECYQPNYRTHFRGSLSMAHAGRDTGGSQFFLTFVPTDSLNGIHTVFGRVINGFDVLSKIQRRDPEKPDQPDPDKIIEAKVIRKRPHEYTVKKSGNR
jgi:cyclophilin family peptidyl-prolyl cis-trans isomerase